MLNWLKEIDGLGSAPLTVRAQALSVDDIDTANQLLHPVFFPYQNGDSIELNNLFTTDKRFVADRREWNARGRYVPQELPKHTKLSMLPIESFDKIGEEEQQRMRESPAGANEAAYREIVGASIPARVRKLVAANYRRVERDSIEAWTKGTITAKNPQSGTSASLSLGYAASRFLTAGTAWDDAGTNAFNDLITWLNNGEAVMGPIKGVMLRRVLLNAILADAPNIVDYGAQGFQPTMAQLKDAIRDRLTSGSEFTFIVNESADDVFNDGGTAVTRANVFPAGYCTAIPASTVIGSTHRVPSVRAMDLAAQFPGAKIDERGMSITYDSENGGKTAVIECQANWLAVPEERWCWSINTLVT
jgi:hypothetical protein